MNEAAGSQKLKRRNSSPQAKLYYDHFQVYSYPHSTVNGTVEDREYHRHILDPGSLAL